jgi:hypothetical protein
MHGEHPEGHGADRVLAMRAAQRRACERHAPTCRFVPTAPFAVLNGTTYNGIYHYNGRADTFFYIGQAMGRAMIELLRERDEKTPVVPPPVDEEFSLSSGAAACGRGVFIVVSVIVSNIRNILHPLQRYNKCAELRTVPCLLTLLLDS